MKVQLSGANDLRRRFSALRKSGIDRAISRGINDTTRKTRTLARREVRKATGERAKEVNKAVNMIGANPRRLTAQVIARSYTPNLIKLTPRKDNLFHRARRKAKYKGRGSSRAQYKRPGLTAKAYGRRKIYDHMWVHEMGGRSAIVLHRKGPSRHSPIELAQGPDINRAFASRHIQTLIDRYVRAHISKDVDASIRRAIKAANL